MIDPSLLRNHPEQVAQILAKRGMVVDVAKLRELEDGRKSLQVKTQHLQSERNRISKEIGMAKSKKLPVDDLLAEGEKITQGLEGCEKELAQVLEKQNHYWSFLPNILHESVPDGQRRK